MVRAGSRHFPATTTAFRPLKKSKSRIPRGLKRARNDKIKDLYGTAEAVPFQNIA